MPASVHEAAQVGDAPGTHASGGVVPVHVVPSAHGLPRNEPVGRHASWDVRHDRPGGQAFASPHAVTHTSTPGLETHVSELLTTPQSASPLANTPGASHCTTHREFAQTISASGKPLRF
jgi:hypothetical protein